MFKDLPIYMFSVEHPTTLLSTLVVYLFILCIYK